MSMYRGLWAELREERERRIREWAESLDNDADKYQLDDAQEEVEEWGHHDTLERRYWEEGDGDGKMSRINMRARHILGDERYQDCRTYLGDSYANGN